MLLKYLFILMSLFNMLLVTVAAVIYVQGVPIKKGLFLTAHPVWFVISHINKWHLHERVGTEESAAWPIII